MSNGQVLLKSKKEKELDFNYTLLGIKSIIGNGSVQMEIQGNPNAQDMELFTILTDNLLRRLISNVSVSYSKMPYFTTSDKSVF
ncbi:hypothetical protein M5X06_08895 [Paenibacillus alvei]|uniref:Uncharacterized protein n=1 Tax=Paenibacillus alvei TaxID=44250 RepID=A0ABT4H5R6_PAEAL|nr:hypothetical protein [Paenibacillus alvei]MCY9764333.1 hypothetical protein [Paenibacillus alvei]MCY9766949.1 hypothetical protein [Paenibacillus alvei]